MQPGSPHTRNVPIPRDRSLHTRTNAALVLRPSIFFSFLSFFFGLRFFRASYLRSHFFLDLRLLVSLSLSLEFLYITVVVLGSKNQCEERKCITQSHCTAVLSGRTFSRLHLMACLRFLLSLNVCTAQHNQQALAAVSCAPQAASLCTSLTKFALLTLHSSKDCHGLESTLK